MAKPFLSVVVPSYNEAERITETLFEFDRFFSTVDYSYEILIIEDGSKDNTAEVVSKLCGVIHNLRLIDNHRNIGKGGVVTLGMMEAKGSIRFFVDADNATPIEQIEKFLPFFKEGYGVVFGSRGLKESDIERKQPFYRRFLGRMGNLFIRIVLLPGVKDTQCGFKAFTEEAAQAIFPRLTIKRWGFDIEILAIAKLLGYRIKEVPVRWIDNPQSRVRLKSYLEVLFSVLKIRWKILRKKYI